MKIIRALFAMAVLAMGAVNLNAQDASELPPCIIVNGVKCYLTYDDCGRIIDINCGEGSSGTAQFGLLAPGDPCAPDNNTELDPGQPLNAALVPLAVSVSINTGNLGTITTTLDDSRTPSNTTIVSTEEATAAGQAFPAKARIKFYARAETDGGTYISQTELIFGSDEVNSVAPFENETFTLLNDVNYYREGDEAQTTVFTLQAGSTSFTIDGQEGRGEGGLN